MFQEMLAMSNNGGGSSQPSNIAGAANWSIASYNFAVPSGCKGFLVMARKYAETEPQVTITGGDATSLGEGNGMKTTGGSRTKYYWVVPTAATVSISVGPADGTESAVDVIY